MNEMLSKLRDMVLKYEKEVNPDLSNKYFGEMKDIRKEMDKEGIIMSLKEFFDDKDGCVRLCAAATLLFYEETQKEAEKTLIFLAGDKTQEPLKVRFSAEMTLKEWRKGNLKDWR